MVYVPAGKFLLGSTQEQVDTLHRQFPGDPPEWFTDELTQCRVSLLAYWMDKNPVTVAQYRKFCGVKGRDMPEAPDWGWQDSHPMTNVRWADAAAYAKSAGKRLPTELEWEKAARGTDGRIYPWGNRWDASKCANGTNSTNGTRPVETFHAGASPYGCLDMAGNVWQWCAEWYEEKAYERYAKGDLTPPTSGTHKVLRSTGWGNDDPRYFRCAARIGFVQDRRGGALGFRCARGAE